MAQVSLAEAAPKYARSRSLHASGWLSQQDLEAAQAGYDSARENLALAERQAATARTTVEVFRRGEDDTVVRAPFAGVVTVKAAQPGEIVSPIPPAAASPAPASAPSSTWTRLEVEVDVSESFISRVHAGQPASVKLNAYPDWEIPAR